MLQKMLEEKYGQVTEQEFRMALMIVTRETRFKRRLGFRTYLADILNEATYIIDTLRR